MNPKALLTLSLAGVILLFVASKLAEKKKMPAKETELMEIDVTQFNALRMERGELPVDPFIASAVDKPVFSTQFSDQRWKQ
jgi:hypothetical protein